MRLPTLLASLLCGLTVVSACTSVDAERNQLRGALRNATGLASEIEAWQKRTEPSVSETAVDTIGSFKDRANTILDSVAGVSDNATTGVDLTGVKQALTEIVEFDTSRIADASQTGRASVVRQLGGLADSLQSAVARVRVPM